MKLDRQTLVVFAGVIIIASLLLWSWMSPTAPPNLKTPDQMMTENDRTQIAEERTVVLPTPASFQSIDQAEAHVRKQGGEIIRNLLDGNRIRILKFTNRMLIDEDLAVLTQLTEVKSLRLFEASRFQGTGLRYVENCEELESLFVVGSALSDEHLIFLRELHLLNFLDLSDNNLDGTGLDFLKGLSNLKTVALDDNPIVEPNFHVLGQLPALEDLSVIRTGFGDQSCPTFSSMATLKRLNVASTQLTDAGVESISRIPQLAVLNLSGTSITDASLRSLSACPQLFNLDISQTAVSDEGLLLLLACPRLNFLDISGTRVTKAALLRLATESKIRKITVQNTGLVAGDLETEDIGSVRIVFE